MSKKLDVELLKNLLKKLHKVHEGLCEVAPEDLGDPNEDRSELALEPEPLDPKTLAKMSEEDRKEYDEYMEFICKSRAERYKCLNDLEQAARLADEYGFDGRIFRDPPKIHYYGPGDYYDSLLRRVRKQIETVPRLIAAIERPVDKSVLDDSEYFTIYQLAEYLKMGLGTVREWHKKGKLPKPLPPPKSTDGKKHSTAKLKWDKKEIVRWKKVSKEKDYLLPRDEWEQWKKDEIEKRKNESED